MLANIFMCPFYVQYFYEKGSDKNVRKLCHLYCKCKDDHECFIYTSRSHSYIHKRIDGI